MCLLQTPPSGLEDLDVLYLLLFLQFVVFFCCFCFCCVSEFALFVCLQKEVGGKKKRFAILHDFYDIIEKQHVCAVNITDSRVPLVDGRWTVVLWSQFAAFYSCNFGATLTRRSSHW